MTMEARFAWCKPKLVEIKDYKANRDMTSLMYHDLIQEKCNVLFLIQYDFLDYFSSNYVKYFINPIKIYFVAYRIISDLKTIQTYETPKIRYDIILHDANFIASYDNMILYYI